MVCLCNLNKLNFTSTESKRRDQLLLFTVHGMSLWLGVSRKWKAQIWCSHSFLSSHLLDWEYLAAVSVIFNKYVFCNLVPECLPCKLAVTSCLTRESELYLKLEKEFVLHLMNIILEGHYWGHYLFYFIFSVSTHLKTNSHLRCYDAINPSLVVRTII